MNPNDVVTVVSGLPRSGTSMMMSMLEAGGIPLLVDGVRQADEDNPKGYFELERVKQMKKDANWLSTTRGKAVKVISQLLTDLPPTQQYRLVFMHRHIDEILASQKQMLIRRGTYQEGTDDAEMGELLLGHVKQVLNWVKRQPNFELLEADYNAVLKDARPHIDRINAFFGGRLNTAAMMAVVDKALYRQRKA